jgi:hypothetical protein
MYTPSCSFTIQENTEHDTLYFKWNENYQIFRGQNFILFHIMAYIMLICKYVDMSFKILKLCGIIYTVRLNTKKINK